MQRIFVPLSKDEKWLLFAKWFGGIHLLQSVDRLEDGQADAGGCPYTLRTTDKEANLTSRILTDIISIVELSFTDNYLVLPL